MKQSPKWEGNRVLGRSRGNSRSIYSATTKSWQLSSPPARCRVCCRARAELAAGLGRANPRWFRAPGCLGGKPTLLLDNSSQPGPFPDGKGGRKHQLLAGRVSGGEKKTSVRLQIIFSSCQKSTDPNCSLSSRGVRCSIRQLVQLRQQSIRGSTTPGDGQALWKRFRVLQEAFLKPNPEQGESFGLPVNTRAALATCRHRARLCPRALVAGPVLEAPRSPTRWSELLGNRERALQSLGDWRLFFSKETYGCKALEATRSRFYSCNR